MEIGDKIIAIINIRWMTKNEEYCVEQSTDKGIYVRNNNGNLNFYQTKDICSYFKLPSKEAATGNKVFGSTPSHYDNTNGSLYLFAEQHKLNAWEFEVIKRIVRCRKKGEFLTDIEKTIKVLELYRDEQGDNYKGQFEPLNK